MANFVTAAKNKNGELNISMGVFEAIASDTLASLAADELKDKLILSHKNRRSKIEALIDKKGKLILNLSIIFSSDSDVENSSRLIQSKIHDAICEVTDVSDIKVNITISSIVTLDR